MSGEWRTDPDDWEAQDDHPVLRSSEGHWLSLTRRGVLKGGLGLAAVFVGGCAVTGGARPRIGFTPLPAQTDPGFDAVRVPAGYRAVPFYSWGIRLMPRRHGGARTPVTTGVINCGRPEITMTGCTISLLRIIPTGTACW